MLPCRCKFSLKMDQIYSFDALGTSLIYVELHQHTKSNIFNIFKNLLVFNMASRNCIHGQYNRCHFKKFQIFCSKLVTIYFLGFLLNPVKTLKASTYDYVPCYVHKLLNLIISKCLLFGPCAPYEGSVGNEDFSVLMLQKCYPEFLQKQLLLKR